MLHPKQMPNDRTRLSGARLQFAWILHGPRLVPLCCFSGQFRELRQARVQMAHTAKQAVPVDVVTAVRSLLDVLEERGCVGEQDRRSDKQAFTAYDCADVLPFAGVLAGPLAG